MLAEINYWRDMSRVLEAINNELKQSYVEMVVQILTCARFDKDIQQFQTQKSRIFKGAKEARWNFKYIKILTPPVQQVEHAT